MSIAISYEYVLENKLWLVKLAGELDVSTTGEVKKTLNEMLDKEMLNVKIDISELEYIDSTGLGVLIGILKRVKTNGKEIEIVNPKKNVLKIFSITGMDKIFKMEG